MEDTSSVWHKQRPPPLVPRARHRRRWRARNAGVKEERSLGVWRSRRRHLVFPVVRHVERSGGRGGVASSLLQGGQLLPCPGLALVARPAGGHGAGPGGEVRSVVKCSVGHGQVAVRLVRHVCGAGSAGRGGPVGVVPVAGGHPGMEGGVRLGSPGDQPGELGAHTGGGGGRRSGPPTAAGPRRAAGSGQVRSVVQQAVTAAWPEVFLSSHCPASLSV